MHPGLTEMSTIRAILNREKWASGRGLDDVEVVIVHRGAPRNVRVIRGRDIRDIAPRALICVDGASTGGSCDGSGSDEVVVIPFHRILLIRRGSQTIWKSRRTGTVETAV